jgi:hypothetical protein
MMNRIAVDMPVVGECSVVECAYNANNGCHARAITVGDGIHAGCDTYLVATPHSRDQVRHAGVGACKVSACEHNDDYECTAQHIAVGHDGHAGHGATCLTYLQRALPKPQSHPKHR